MTPKTYLIPVPPREGECVTGPLNPGAPSGAGPPGPVPLTAHRAPGALAGAPPGAPVVELPSLEKDVPKAPARRIGNVLLVSSSRHPDQWIVPGGGMEPEEEPCGAAVREVFEEETTSNRFLDKDQDFTARISSSADLRPLTLIRRFHKPKPNIAITNDYRQTNK
ncbi:unnamed protein product, partial [Arctogadus glacialis]